MPRLITCEVTCRVCGEPGKVQCEPSPLVDLEPLLKCYTCDNCMVDKGYMRREQARLPEMPLPYKDT